MLGGRELRWGKNYKFFVTNIGLKFSFTCSNVMLATK